MRFIVFENLKHLSSTVTRIYPVQNIAYFEYDKIGKLFKIQHVNGSWHTIKNDGDEVVRNAKVFENFLTTLKDKIVIK